MSRERLVRLDALWDGEMRGYTVAGCKLLLVKLDGQAFAYEDRCAHLGVALSQGRLEAGVITCSAHHYQYCGRTGAGINPRAVKLRGFPVVVEDGWVAVGPVLEAGPVGSVLAAAIRERHPDAEIEDRGSYLRVLVPRRCVLAREAVERLLGRDFRLPGDLELDEAVWEVGPT
jgi:toluene monooxygenase system ferredoxin subunit